MYVSGNRSVAGTQHTPATYTAHVTSVPRQVAAEPKNLNPAVAKPPPPPAKWSTSGDIGEFRQDLQAEVQRFSGLSIKGTEIFPKNFIDKIQASESVRLSDNIKGILDREYNAVRFYIGKYPDMNVMSFFMNKTGEVTRVLDLNNGPDAATIAQISAAGGLRHSITHKSAFPQGCDSGPAPSA